MLSAALVSLKQHRFEVGAAALACIVLGVWGFTVRLRLGSIGVSQECLETWAAVGPEGAGECAGLMGAWGSLASEATRIIGVMAYLPFAVGLLGGVPIVARELESRTVQTAWSLNASRLRWFVRQTLPILALLGVAVTFAGLVAGGVQADRELYGESAYFNLGHHGPLVVARAFGAFGLGLLVGALIGRTLPAFVLAAALCLVLVLIASTARGAWLSSLEPVPATNVGDAGPGIEGLVITEIAWRAPDGTVLTRAQARDVAAAAGVPPADTDDIQDVPALTWFEENGYTELALGVTEETALGWGLYDALLFSLAGAASLAATLAVVSRRRPA